MWELLIKAINNKNEAEALMLIDLMKPEDFIKNCETMTWDKIPSHLAIHHGLEKVLNALILKNPLLLMNTDDCGSTALHLAVMNENISIVDMILTIAPKSVNIRDKLGSTALHYAIYNEAITCKILAINSDLVNIANNKGLTAVKIAMIANSTGYKLMGIPEASDITKYGRCEAVVDKLLSVMKEMNILNELCIVSSCHQNNVLASVNWVNNDLSIKNKVSSSISLNDNKTQFTKYNTSTSNNNESAFVLTIPIVQAVVSMKQIIQEGSVGDTINITAVNLDNPPVNFIASWQQFDRNNVSGITLPGNAMTQSVKIPSNAIPGSTIYIVANAKDAVTPSAIAAIVVTSPNDEFINQDRQNSDHQNDMLPMGASSNTMNVDS